jgi:HAD superfamily hydrolase (TIGR01509 family)
VNKDNQGWAVVFDLDETLVLTSALESLRNKRLWKEAYKAFGQTRLPDGTVQFIKNVTQIAQVGVVTKSPSAYAQKLLAYYHLQVPVLAGFHDVTRRKPYPDALLLASRKLGIPPERSIYVGDDADDVRAARAAGYTPLGICWGAQADIGLNSVCKSWAEAYNEIVRVIRG